MTQTILQRFLDSGLLTVAEDDEKYTLLLKTSQEIAQQFAERRQEIISSTLVALDPHVAPDDPSLQGVETALKQHWKTVRNRFPDIPSQLFRAILLDALHTAGQAEVAVATMVWLTGASYLPLVDLGRETTICEALLREMGDIAEAHAVEQWSQLGEDHISFSPEYNLTLPCTQAS